MTYFLVITRTKKGGKGVILVRAAIIPANEVNGFPNPIQHHRDLGHTLDLRRLSIEMAGNTTSQHSKQNLVETNPIVPLIDLLPAGANAPKVETKQRDVLLNMTKIGRLGESAALVKLRRRTKLIQLKLMNLMEKMSGPQKETSPLGKAREEVAALNENLLQYENIIRLENRLKAAVDKINTPLRKTLRRVKNVTINDGGKANLDADEEKVQALTPVYPLLLVRAVTIPEKGNRHGNNL